MNSEPDIVIIGAGAAGIGAARGLDGHGLSVVVLEAMQRVGGRAWTKDTHVGPLDLGCGWLHSADRNPWTAIAENSGFEVRRGPTAWGSQYRGLGFPPEEEQAARQASAALLDRLARNPPKSDRASDALSKSGRWNVWLNAISGFGNGAELGKISAKDYVAYESASTKHNWRVAAGYGTLISQSNPKSAEIILGTPVEAMTLLGSRVELRTPRGTLWPRMVIMTVSTNVLSGTSMVLPPELDPWRQAASAIPLGNNEKLFIEIVGNSDFEPETHIIGNPHDPETGSYYIRPFSMPVIECFLGGAGARAASRDGASAAYSVALEQLGSLFGSDACKSLRPLVSSDWARTPYIGGAYSHALPRQADARKSLASPFEGRIFFAGEATHPHDFSTAHGALESGLRAAGEVLAK
jgi:monoamine oxidase